jgi:hypothetical protein
VAAIGLVAFALWQLAAAAVGFRWISGNARFRKRVGAIAKAIAMSGLAVIVMNYLPGLRSGGATTPQGTAAGVLALPAGRPVLGLLAAGILAIAAAMTYTGLRRTFMTDLDVNRLAPATRRTVELLGAVGHLARALALAVVGVLVSAAALHADPNRAGGLDAALRALGATTPGAWLLVAVAAGFAAFGLFSFADAATRRA